MQPQFMMASSESITIAILKSEDNGGSPITGYKLFADSGDDFSSSFVQITNYDGLSATYSTQEADGFVLGKVYRFRTCATN